MKLSIHNVKDFRLATKFESNGYSLTFALESEEGRFEMTIYCRPNPQLFHHLVTLLEDEKTENWSKEDA